MEEEAQKVDLITLLRTFKKEGLDNFIVIRKEKFENNFIPKSLVKEKIEELKQKAISYGTFIDKDESFNIQSKISVLQNLLGE